MTSSNAAAKLSDQEAKNCLSSGQDRAFLEVSALEMINRFYHETPTSRATRYEKKHDGAQVMRMWYNNERFYDEDIKKTSMDSANFYEIMKSSNVYKKVMKDSDKKKRRNLYEQQNPNESDVMLEVKANKKNDLNEFTELLTRSSDDNLSLFPMIKKNPEERTYDYSTSNEDKDEPGFTRYRFAPIKSIELSDDSSRSELLFPSRNQEYGEDHTLFRKRNNLFEDIFRTSSNTTSYDIKKLDRSIP